MGKKKTATTRRAVRDLAAHRPKARAARGGDALAQQAPPSQQAQVRTTALWSMGARTHF
jgi:hypothetical protein